MTMTRADRVHRARSSSPIARASPSRSSPAACAATAGSTRTAATSRPAPATGCRPSRPGRPSTGRTEPFGTEVIDVPLETWPGNFPNVAQARFLISSGVPRAAHRHPHPHRHGRGLRRQHPAAAAGEPAAASSSRTSAAPPSTTSAGACSRPTAATRPASRSEAGHQRHVVRRPRHRLPRAARPTSTSPSMLERMGFGQGPPARRPDPASCPTTSTPNLEFMVDADDPGAAHRGAGVPHLRLGRAPGCPTPISSPATARRPASCRYIRTDETPHVGYLAAALTEMRDRTWIGEGGKQHAGADMIGRLWDRLLEQSLGEGRAADQRGHPRRGRALVQPGARTAPPSEFERWLPTPSAASGHVVKFGIFYEHQLPRPWDGGQRAAGSSRTPSSRSSWPTASASTCVWEVEHHFLEEYSHSSAPEVFLAAASQRTQQHPPRPRHRPDRARPTTTPPAPPSASPCSTSSPAAGSSSAPGESSSEAELGGFGIDPCYQARAVARGPRGRHPLHDGDAVHGRRRPVRARCRRATSCPSRCRSRTRRCGWRARGATRSCSPPRRASGPWRSPSSTRRRPATGSPTTRRRSPRSASRSARPSTPASPA